MIKKEFLAFKYQGLKTIYELKKSDKLKTNLGWKCRKYQNWSDVHENESDKNALREFGGKLIEESDINLDLLGDVNAVLLNVQRWRLDKENFDIDPPIEEAYQKLNVLLENVEKDRQYINSYLLDQNFDLEDIRDNLQIIFYSHLLTDFFKSVTDHRLSMRAFEAVKEDQLVPFFNKIYKEHGLSISTEGDTKKVLIDVFNDLGFQISFSKSLSVDTTVKRKHNQTIVKYKKMNIGQLMNVSSVSGSTLVEVNKNNLFIKKVLSDNDPDKKENIELVIKSLATSYLDLTDNQEVLDTFFSYLSLKLNDKVREIR